MCLTELVCFIKFSFNLFTVHKQTCVYSSGLHYSRLKQNSFIGHLKIYSSLRAQFSRMPRFEPKKLRSELHMMTDTQTF